MSSLYFGLDVFCQFEARVPEFDAVYSVHCTQYTSTAIGEEILRVKFYDSSLKLGRTHLARDTTTTRLCGS
jgi:hypothetical protein